MSSSGRKAPRVLELFSCLGGMSEGFRRAGLAVTEAVDFDSDACDSYEQNLGHRPLQLDIKKQIQLLGRAIESGDPYDFVLTDPPCKSWSDSGKRQGIADPRDCLLETIAIISHAQPKAWLLANVPGMANKKNKPLVDRALSYLTGYDVHFKMLNAADFGVAQKRKRPFWIGLPPGTPFQWPEPSHPEGSWITCRQALGHLPAEGLGRPVKLRWSADSHRDHRPNRWDLVGKTVAGNPNGDGALIEPKSQHGPDAIVLSEVARLILQGFPEDWVVCGKTKKSRDAQIGMAMPPPLAEVVARSICEALGW